MLSDTPGQGIDPQQPAMPSRIAIDLLIVRHGRGNLLIKPAPRFDRQPLAQRGVLLREIFQMRADSLQSGALGDIDQLGTVIVMSD